MLLTSSIHTKNDTTSTLPNSSHSNLLNIFFLYTLTTPQETFFYLKKIHSLLQESSKNPFLLDPFASRMTEVIHSSPSSSSPSANAVSHSHRPHNVTFHHEDVVFEVREGNNEDTKEEEEEEEEEEAIKNKNKRNTTNQLSLLALLVALFRKSFWVACKAGGEEVCTTSRGSGSGGIEIGHPTNVQHVSHVTFDRFNGFLGLPVEFEPDVPRRAPSASTTVFGVSTESMQLSFDHRGNSIPTILLQMQRRLYGQGGLQAEGIFRINGGNSQNEYVRDQLNRGVIPDSIDVHCLAGLIKAWFRELPRGVLDPLPPERVMQCQSEEECVSLVRLLPPTETALLDWSINLMADVVQEEHLNKMNSRNIAMVFAPNMTQMSDPLTALMYAVQVMNFLRTLIERALRERQDTVVEPPPLSQLKPSDEDGQQKNSRLDLENVSESNEVTKRVFFVEEPDSDTSVVEYDSDTVSDTAAIEYDSDTVSVTAVVDDSGTVSNTSRVEHDSETSSDSYHSDNISEEEVVSYSASAENSNGSESCETPIQDYIISIIRDGAMSFPRTSTDESTQIRKTVSSDSNQAKSVGQQCAVRSVVTEGKSKGVNNQSRINSITERVEAWRR